MVKARSGVPRGYQAVMPYLRVRDAASAIRFYKKVLGATEHYRLKMDGKIGHAELDIGGCTLMLSDEFPEFKALGPKSLKGTSVVLTVYVDNVDQLVAKAAKAGARIRRPAADQFYGDRTAQIEDPFGHVWSIQTRIEKVSPKDMQKRLDTLLKSETSAAVTRRRAGGGAKGGRSKAAAKPAATRTATSKTSAAPSRKKKASPARKPTTRKAAASKAPAGTRTAARKTMVAQAPEAQRGRKAGPRRAGRPRKATKG